ncbi:hypothetical protein [Oceanobacillus iheyensis HTE831]|uniref:Uncharacterized protein n=1 Tax=Oceanobacillus iheyensis (strain DSM 14371 / CIP 107618 / JCM 11309 / KCTC 3954 / HTE831) TaxID=221109 RepID=Q8EL84_OCEIH|nr:hypothetical protein [Oceanobacillus iheyensis]BAC15303.1 hypothetical protein [Oceanobacillus iheyensis HTE831]
MKDKFYLIGYSLVFIGVALFIVKSTESVSIYYIDYITIIIGIGIILVASLIYGKEKNILCRAGWHRFEHVGMDDEIKFALIYKCKRCGRTKRVVRSSGGGLG